MDGVRWGERSAACAPESGTGNKDRRMFRRGWRARCTAVFPTAAANRLRDFVGPVAWLQVDVRQLRLGGCRLGAGGILPPGARRGRAALPPRPRGLRKFGHPPPPPPLLHPDRRPPEKE